MSLALLVLSLVAEAMPPTEPVARTVKDEPSVEDTIGRLDSADTVDRWKAARTLRSEVKRALRLSEHGLADDITSLEARQDLMVFDDRLAPMCIQQLTVTNLTKVCADILGLLETEAAIPSLEARLATETRGGVQARLERAIARIHQASP